jgi:hypothetical protein
VVAYFAAAVSYASKMFITIAPENIMLAGCANPGKKLVRSIPFEKLVTYTKRASLLLVKCQFDRALLDSEIRLFCRTCECTFKQYLHWRSVTVAAGKTN